MTSNPRINVKFNEEKGIKALAESAVQNFKTAFCKTQECSFPEEINLYPYTTKSEYENYLKGNNIDPIKQAQHFTLAKSGDKFDVYSYLDRQKSEHSDLSIKRGVAHALIENNEKWGKVLPTSFKVGMADYVAGLNNNGEVQNNNDDKRDFEWIKKHSLHLNEILGNSKLGGLAEQAVKFLESRYDENLKQLLHKIDTKTVKEDESFMNQFLHKIDTKTVKEDESFMNQFLHKIDTKTVKEGRSFVDQFIKDIGEYNSEFSEWIAEQDSDLI